MERKILEEKIYSKIDELPTLPMVVPKIISLVENDKSNTSDLTDVISNDLALTSKILKVANSAYYGFQQRISDLRKAVALLGFNMVKSLALSIGIIQTFPSGNRSRFFSVEGLWLHSISVATLICELDRRFGDRNASESLFIIGLLHDLGKIVLDQFFSDLFYQTLEEAANEEGMKLHIAEKKIIGIDHCEVAGILLKRWKFPLTMINTIAFHHHSELPEGTSPVDVAMLRIANIIAQMLGLGDEGNTNINDLHESDLKLLRMDDKNFEDMITYSHSIKEEIQTLFNAMI